MYRRSLSGHPQPAAALRRAGTRAGSRAGAGSPAGLGGRLVPGALTLHERELLLGQRVADRGQLLRRRALEQRQQRAHGVDRELHLAEVALVLGARYAAGSAHPEVHHRDHVLEQDLLDAQALDLLLVGGPQLLLGERARVGAVGCHHFTSTVLGVSCAYVAALARTVAA